MECHGLEKSKTVSEIRVVPATTEEPSGRPWRNAKAYEFCDPSEVWFPRKHRSFCGRSAFCCSLLP